MVIPRRMLASEDAGVDLREAELLQDLEVIARILSSAGVISPARQSYCKIWRLLQAKSKRRRNGIQRWQSYCKIWRLLQGEA